MGEYVIVSDIVADLAPLPGYEGYSPRQQNPGAANF